MMYHSTRSAELKVDSAQAVLSGLAPDGGLYIFDNVPDFDVEACLADNVQGMATRILSALLPDIPDMKTLVSNAYTGTFDTEELTPSLEVGPYTILELFHGPTSAFKDVALRMLPQLMTASKKLKGADEDILILTATSGVTGKSALAGFMDVEGTKICVFYPYGGVSKVQRAQMVTQLGNNVAVCAVKGNFDDAQTGVKKIFSAASTDDSIKAELKSKGIRLSSANSINIGRLAPQVTYYFKAYSDLMKRNKIKFGDEVNFTVPTGNFGDILAGYIAKLLGLPVGRLICASNANNVLTDFIHTGTYNRLRPLHKTTSPSMDILVSSNLERMLYLLSGNDTELVSSLMKKLNTEGEYTIPADMLTKLQSIFYSDCSDDEQVKSAMKKVYDEYGYVIDPHTATGWNAAEKYTKDTNDTRVNVILSTASPYKFPSAVLDAIDEDYTADTDEFVQMKKLNAISGTEIPQGLKQLETMTERHTGVIEKDDMMKFVLSL